MKIRDPWGKPIDGGGQIMTNKFFSGMTLTIALLLAGGGVLRGQEALEMPDPPDAGQVMILAGGPVHLGVTLGDVTAENTRELKLPAVAGALVNKVQKESAAAKAGIEPGDVIIEFDDVHVRSSAELRRLIRETPAGRTVAIKLVRGGKTRAVSATLEACNHNFDFSIPEIHIPPMNFPEYSFGSGRATLGISGEDLTPQLAQYFSVKQGKGVLVFEVTAGGAADKAGLKAGDVIVQVDGKPISGVEQLRSTLNENFTEDTRKVSLTIVRDHHEQTVKADLSRSRPPEKGRSSMEGSRSNPAHSEVQAQRMLTDQQRAAAARVRAGIQKQQEQVQGAWRHQLQEQMRALKDELRQMQNQPMAILKDGEI
jgi:membrane-associated protease RseP (regulator of RpoE activity)